MNYIFSILFLIIFAINLVLWFQSRSLRKDLEDEVRYLGSRIRRSDDALREELELTKKFLARSVAGHLIDETMLKEGRIYGDISSEEVQKKIDSEQKDFTLVDVRSRDEFTQGHIPGALSISLDEIETKGSSLSGGKNMIVVHCQSGGRSMQACELLSQMGYINLYNMPGGFGSWKGKTEKGIPNDNLDCSCCKQLKKKMKETPMPGTLGDEIVSQVCQDCWNLWKEQQIKVINEFQLKVFRPEHQEIIKREMRGFLHMAGAEQEGSSITETPPP